MIETLFWLYLFNLLLIIPHEMYSAFWKEWNLFRLPEGNRRSQPAHHTWDHVLTDLTMHQPYA